MRYIPYIIAILCLFYAFVELKAQDRTRWRVTYINNWDQEIRLGTKHSLGGCIAAIKLIYAEEPHHYYCTADQAEAITAAQSTPRSTVEPHSTSASSK